MYYGSCIFYSIIEIFCVGGTYFRRWLSPAIWQCMLIRIHQNREPMHARPVTNGIYSRTNIFLGHYSIVDLLTHSLHQLPSGQQIIWNLFDHLDKTPRSLCPLTLNIQVFSDIDCVAVSTHIISLTIFTNPSSEFGQTTR